MADPEKPVTPERIMGLAWGYAPPLILEAAVRCRVFDLLDAGPKNVGQVAAATGRRRAGWHAPQRPRRPGVARQKRQPTR